MITQTIDNVTFQLSEPFDFSFLSEYGKVFCVFDANDSGNISFGVEDGRAKYFVKVAGAKTKNYTGDTGRAVISLQQAMPLYVELKHPSLIELLECRDMGNAYVAVFRWATGDCLFDYWNFETYAKEKRLSPMSKFKNLSVAKRLASFQVIFEFLCHVESKGFVAVDFYDGSILYDFSTDETRICDIDFFRKKPAINNMGADFWGTKRLKAPEEYVLGASIDAQTNVHTLGALIFHFFGRYEDDEIKRMYRTSHFYPCAYENFELSRERYDIALRATHSERPARYKTIGQFFAEWESIPGGGADSKNRTP